uniref:non-specific serine/threonine protein kinase n=1 Tax=Saccharum hybrid cultivar R570 TaxID=131158 RepID=A0A059PYY5_9POAL|nr:Jacalin-like lectin domain containing protein [Saccharum hybrid cultivar R570]AGT16239.1 Jacalin-like lectin domain containing protein [Saccharum hybrid cultivar R570]
MNAVFVYFILYAEEHDGIDWQARYKIIKGICEGLDYLHGGLKEPIFHLDLKPENILLGVDMAPKIADFGLSRLLNGTHTHTTKVCKGTHTCRNYMPPEFIEKRQISHKYDVFSLGIIIIQIITGLEGFKKYAEMSSPEQFVELVHKNWKQRIGSTKKYAEEDCLQVKTCLEIALSCVEPDKAKRPSIRDIVCELRKTETNGTGSSWDKVKVAKIGKWGGVGGRYNDIEIAPQRLESLTIQSGEVIYSLEFSYSDHSGQQHTGGWYVDAFGIYVKPEQEELEEEEAGVVKIGPWGGDGGIPRDIKVAPQRLDSVTICSGVVVDSLEFSYHGQDGQKHTVGPWGGTGGSSCLIELGPSEFLMGAYGTRGPFTNSPADVVTSLTLVTNARSYGPFGHGGGRPFQVPMQGNSSIVGFFGCAGSYIDAIGVYVKPGDQQQHKAMEQEGSSNGILMVVSISINYATN